MGNHDVRTHQGEDEVAYAGYNMSGRYYTFTKQIDTQTADTQASVQFFALDTNQFYSQNRHRENAWAEQLRWLRTELRRSSARWKVVFAHHTIYSSSRYHGSDRALANALVPMFKAYGVQLYLNGHDHHYERTVAIDGTTYFTIGNGAKLRPVDNSADWSAYATSQLGFATFEVYTDRMVVKAIDTSNTVFDQTAVPVAIAN